VRQIALGKSRHLSKKVTNDMSAFWTFFGGMPKASQKRPFLRALSGSKRESGDVVSCIHHDEGSFGVIIRKLF
jgi:hypothetical protein